MASRRNFVVPAGLLVLVLSRKSRRAGVA